MAILGFRGQWRRKVSKQTNINARMHTHTHTFAPTQKGEFNFWNWPAWSSGLVEWPNKHILSHPPGKIQEQKSKNTHTHRACWTATLSN